MQAAGRVCAINITGSAAVRVSLKGKPSLIFAVFVHVHKDHRQLVNDARF